ncbi:hypothetical protein AAW14_20135 [Streptomyces hygroscopicus]|uniref:triphosphoribosyl-dephospho-CoA synthase n=1 Tax=Streptomyces hygroscopicus TaxID=1912 RepID=UPI0022400C5E|nr:triphosphoribosyl-dephospho-CoA synthase [Streptomyces hygroscopicus]MCW7944349.1 hypothetical protein [Streptomyces hygroscopicus]
MTVTSSRKPLSAGTAPNPDRLADLAVHALVREAELTPKPGLVDRRGRGAHTDMDLPLMLRSAHRLRPGFGHMAALATRHRRPCVELREDLAAAGRRAEKDMLAATGGVNTHRGAVWALGLLVAAAAMLPARSGAAAVSRTAGRIARFPDRACPPEALAGHGAAVRARYGAHGARGQAEAGFPHVVRVALPALAAARARGAGEDRAQLDALMALMAGLDDTCLLHRGGPAGLRRVQLGASRVIGAGGCATEAGTALLNRLDTELALCRLSPGGSADLLAAALFLDLLET